MPSEPDDAERLALLWADRWDVDPHDAGPLPGAPTPDVCDHMWYPVIRAPRSPLVCYRGCGARQPAGFVPDAQSAARLDAYAPALDRVTLARFTSG
ncbi:hypothetical protein [Parafrankia sp. EUN1f]|uniref:hypothetical protein n=1 Tax=Parafrankia sp. EUN1f TaxID=102897 RepID=UPI0001C46CF5|nr:hypothetical protein [Parafrankia sp. EUN1f]EFC80164.1 hypothetical protein FrEUN1fDRAFT_6693 [Parafrankia sp. EUN1f]